MLSAGFLQGGLQANLELKQPRLQQLEQKGSCLNTVGSHDVPLTVSSTLSFPGSAPIQYPLGNLGLCADRKPEPVNP